MRIFNTYGPRMNIDDGRVVPAFIGAALDEQPLPLHGEGLQTRSFCYVADLVAGLLAVAIDTTADGEVFNLGNPAEITTREAAMHVAHLMGRSAERVEHLPRGKVHPERRKPYISKMRDRFGWEPRVGLDEGLAKTIDYFRSMRSAARARG